MGLFAIDEAHCISEWGIRVSSRVSPAETFAGRVFRMPIAAFTASATQHVRHDILTQLELRNPDKYIASFHRPNLRYLVRECNSAGATFAAGDGSEPLRGPERHRLLPDHQHSRIDGRPSAGEGNCRSRLSRQDG